MLSDSKFEFFADSIHVHRWPHDTPIWDDSIQRLLDETINKNVKKIPVTINLKSVKIQSVEFHSLKKIGVSVPFFKDECRMIFEAQFGELSAHVHIITKSDNFLDVFSRLTSWKKTHATFSSQDNSL